ncbi:C_GCAxxG_C_C family probable redox protein [Clostridium cavendishii DSM 21758]|uniref:C_GCAxxG_C_C family probable redox protein n=1 Tax=Clostridium cavendishii DSM 21758 TaxID=1121302 RepID=A0A1M6EY18_9CLOT|nr:C-GCAxxG-C-C family (seleno)protein [Clostridium cavendishii]SHI90333.1 C_GCAxxG_C_C family probable redox protein [Clostridium cavendishii DSM 21758]
MKKASGYHKQGYNCGEAMIKAFNEDNNTKIPVALGSGMGSGFTVGSVCGAVGAATVILGYLKGREDKEDLNIARQNTKELMTMVREKYGSELCKDLKKNGISCEEIVEYTYESLNEILQENK